MSQDLEVLSIPASSDTDAEVDERNPVDVVMVDADNSNSSQADANQGEENRVEDVIGVPEPDYDIHKSVFYTHKFYKKIIKEDGRAVAKCMMCWQ